MDFWNRLEARMKAYPESWRIHIGAHKTATTHVQDILALRRDVLASQGIDYPTRNTLRQVRFAKTVRPQLKFFKLRERWPFRQMSQWYDLRRIQSAERLPTLLISEEQLLGLSNGLISSVFYPEAEERMRNLRDLLKGGPATLFLSIRNPANIIPSAYSQCLRAGARGIPNITEIRQSSLANPPSWTDLVRRIRKGFPEARLVVWTFEDYIANPDACLDLLIGKPLGDWPSLETPTSTRGMSAETIDRIHALDRSLSRREHIERCAKLAAEDTGRTRFQPFSADEVTEITRTYEKDLATLEREFPGVLHRLPTKGN